MIFANVVAARALGRETRKPVTTSSKISTTPCCRVNSRSDEEFRLDRQPHFMGPASSMIAAAISVKPGLFQPFKHMVARLLRAELRGKPLGIEKR